jgi:hypothetical protein
MEYIQDTDVGNEKRYKSCRDMKYMELHSFNASKVKRLLAGSNIAPVREPRIQDKIRHQSNDCREIRDSHTTDYEHRYLP